MSVDVEIEIRLLGAGDERALANAAEDVFDGPVDAALAREFLADPRHRIAAALEGERLVGFASAVEYVHPDKPAELWVNEVGVAPTHHGRGIGKRLLSALFDAARAAGCRQAWVLTDRANVAAMGLYRAAGGAEAPGDTVMFEFALAAPPTTPDVS